MAHPTQPRIAASFATQSMMRALGAEITGLADGFCEIAAPLLPAFGQQHGAGHAGVTFALGDTAAGARLVARGRVVKAGRRLVVVTAEVEAEGTDGQRRLIAVLQGTMVPVDPA